jgi:hypothetical protein
MCISFKSCSNLQTLDYTTDSKIDLHVDECLQLQNLSMVGRCVKRIEIKGGVKIEKFDLKLKTKICLYTLLSIKAYYLQFPSSSPKLGSFKV